MNEKDRARQQRAKQEGASAFACGKAIDDNPYKTSQWGVGWFWKNGFQEAQQAAAIPHTRVLKCPYCKREFPNLGEVTAHFYNNCQ